ncbi:MAG TPA: diguanylate cyclase [Rhodospirillaceae bacterium]|nr:diguanylate cyclase [Rhodospirillaceae bacterium]
MTKARATLRFPCKDADGAVIGVAHLGIRIDPATADREDHLGGALQTIVQLKQSIEELTKKATTDPLTGEWNRARIEEFAHQELLRHTRYGHPATLIFVDLDHFKSINDDFGHASGDVVLKGFCQIARKCIRATDMIGRWGGEEFVIVLPNSGLSVARMLAERIRKALAEFHFESLRPVTASFGVADCKASDNLEQWVSRADQALYRAKSLGRNRVVTTTADPAAPQQGEKIETGFVRLHWRDFYASGHDVIDREHRNLFDLADAVLAAALGEKPTDDILPMIDSLLNEVVLHFRDEEAILSEIGYPERTEHVGIHKALVAKALQMAKKFSKGKLSLAELFDFLANEVIARHMLTEDRKFFPFLTKPAES